MLLHRTHTPIKPALVQVLKISCSVTRWMRKNKVFLTPQLQYFDHLMWTTDSLEKILMLGKIEDRRRRGKHRVRWSDDINDSMDMNLRKLQQIVKDREAWRAAVHRVAKSRTWLSNWRAATMSWLWSGHHVINFFHLVEVLISVRQPTEYGLKHYL